MESIYEILSNRKVGENEVLTIDNIMYMFTKIGEYRYVVEHCIYLNGKWVDLTGTMTTMEASQMYETILKNQTNKYGK